MALRLLYLIVIRVFGWLALLGREQAGARGGTDMAGCPQEGHRCSSRRRCTGQANTTGNRHVFCQGPPYCCRMWLPSPARHRGQYRVAEVKTHGLASDRGPHWSEVIVGAAHGYRPDMLLMHSPAVSVPVSLGRERKTRPPPRPGALSGSGGPAGDRHGWR